MVEQGWDGLLDKPRPGRADKVRNVVGLYRNPPERASQSRLREPRHDQPAGRVASKDVARGRVFRRTATSLGSSILEPAMRRTNASGTDRQARWKLIAFLTAVLLVAGVQARAQDGGEGQDASFAGAQMVRGTVMAVGPESLTVKTEEGELYHVAVSANTRLTRDRQPVKLAQIKPGDGVGAMGVLDAPTKTVHAVFVGLVNADDLRKAREELGKLFITGRVTAIDDLKISILRPDNVVQVIQVDEGTSFRRGGGGISSRLGGSGATGMARPADTPAPKGESITLADIKVGDRVGGPGAVRDGMFVPTELHVAAPSSSRAKR